VCIHIRILLNVYVLQHCAHETSPRKLMCVCVRFCVCVCVCVCVHTRTYTLEYIHITASYRRDIAKKAHMCVCVCVCVYTLHIRIHSHTYISQHRANLIITIAAHSLTPTLIDDWVRTQAEEAQARVSDIFRRSPGCYSQVSRRQPCVNS